MTWLLERDSNCDHRPCRKCLKLYYSLPHWLCTSQPCQIQVAHLIDSRLAKKQLNRQLEILVLEIGFWLTL